MVGGLVYRGLVDRGMGGLGWYVDRRKFVVGRLS